MVWVRTSIRNLKKCLHGGLNKRLLEAMHINTKNIIDFSANLNPYGPPKFILRAVKEAITDVCLYPDSECDYLRQAISEKIKCAKNEVLVGRGITGHLQSIGLSFINERAVMPAHTYGEYFVISKMMGAKVKFIPMPNLKIEPKAFAENMRRSDVIFICNPNNPTGQYLGKEATKLIVDCAKEKDALVIIDEAYVDFIKNKFDTTKLATDSENLIVLRSFTKSYSIPGIRVGYAVSHEKNIEILAKVAPPWSVSVFEQIAGLEAVKDKKFL
ncbi:MAG: histidinol-phosphate transaminase, partial [Candidatus Thermoplasmatota archaeon]